MGSLKDKLEDVLPLLYAFLGFGVVIPLILGNKLFGIESLWVLSLLVVFASGLCIFIWKKLSADRKPNAELIDPVFGKMEWYKLARTGLAYWEGYMHFEPVGDVVQFCIYAGEMGPTDEQRQMIPELQDQYTTHKAKILSMLEDYTENAGWKFELLSISIDEDTSQQKWSVDFVADTDDDGDMGYTIEFANGEIKHLLAGD